MDRPDTIQILLTEHGIEHQDASALRPPAGRVVVEMLPESQRIGSILLPDAVAGKYRPDVGVVLAVGPGVSLAPGATVCVRGYDGQWVEGFDAGYSTRNQVRIYGVAARFSGETFETDWAESIPLQIVFEGDDINLVATGHNLVIRRDPVVRQEGSFLLPSAAEYRTDKATILSLGPEVSLQTSGGPLAVGERICYDSRGELDFAFGDDPDLAIIQDTAVLVVFDEA